MRLQLGKFEISLGLHEQAQPESQSSDEQVSAGRVQSIAQELGKKSLDTGTSSVTESNPTANTEMTDRELIVRGYQPRMVGDGNTLYFAD